MIINFIQTFHLQTTSYNASFNLTNQFINEINVGNYFSVTNNDGAWNIQNQCRLQKFDIT